MFRKLGAPLSLQCALLQALSHIAMVNKSKEPVFFQTAKHPAVVLQVFAKDASPVDISASN